SGGDLRLSGRELISAGEVVDDPADGRFPVALLPHRQSDGVQFKSLACSGREAEQPASPSRRGRGDGDDAAVAPAGKLSRRGPDRPGGERLLEKEPWPRFQEWHATGSSVAAFPTVAATAQSIARSWASMMTRRSRSAS